jgi:hypothetical protein
MRRAALGTVLVCGLFIAAPARSACDLPGQTATALAARIQELTAALDAEQTASSRALSLFRDYVSCLETPAFDLVDSAQRHQLLRLIAARLKAGADDGVDPDFAMRGLGLISRATALPDADASDWVLRLKLALQVRRTGEIFDALEGFAARHPTELRQVRPDYVAEAIRAITVYDTPRAFDLRRLLFEAEFRFGGVLEPSGQWQELALEYLSRGDRDAARAVAQRISNVSVLIQLASDRRTADLLEANPRRDNFRAALADEVLVLRRFHEAVPRNEMMFIELGELLIIGGQYELLLALTDQVLSRVKTSVDATLPFDDTTGVGWIHDYRARALWAAGRWNDAIAEQRRSLVAKDRNGADVGPTLNLAGQLCNVGRARDAAAILPAADAGSMGPYGRMVRSTIALCIARTSKDAASEAAALKYLREHIGDAPNALLDGLIEAGHNDEASALLVSLLEDERQRSAVLEVMQVITPPAETEREKRIREGRLNLAARPEVKAALDKVGFQGRYDLRL